MARPWARLLRRSPRRRSAASSLSWALAFALGILIGIHFPSFLALYSCRPGEAFALLPRALLPPPDALVPPSALLPPPDDPVPNIVHYVYGLDARPADFSYHAYLAMRSAMTVLEPDTVMFHCVHEPHGYWWDRVKGWPGWTDGQGVQRGMVEVVPARNVETIGRNAEPVTHADILRLEILLRYGGIYLDIDVFVLDSFAKHSLMRHDTVLGMQAMELSFLNKPFYDHEMGPRGLCNAIIVARPGATFIQHWLAAYDTFDSQQWAHHSVEVPWLLARLYPTLVTVLSERAFFWPNWTPGHVHAVHETTAYDFDSGQLAYHAWERAARRHLDKLDPDTIVQHDSSFTRMARRFRAPDELALWREHLALLDA